MIHDRALITSGSTVNILNKLRIYVYIYPHQNKSLFIPTKNPQVAESVAALAINSPLSQHAGSISGEKRGSVKTKKVTTYLDVHQKLSVRQKGKWNEG